MDGLCLDYVALSRRCTLSIDSSIIAYSCTDPSLHIRMSLVNLTVDRWLSLKAMTIRRSIIFAYILCGTFLVAHIINAVIAEALSVPTGLVRPSPGSAREDEIKTSASAMIESIRKSGLFPLPPDPVSLSATGSGAPPASPRTVKSCVKAQAAGGGDGRS